MKLSPTKRRRPQQGLLLVQLLVYMAAAALVVSLATATFWQAFTGVKKSRSIAERASLALGAGERWRDDIRSAGGTVAIETMEQGTRCRIGTGPSAILWTWSEGDLARSTVAEPAPKVWARGLEQVEFVRERRGDLAVWRLDTTLARIRKTERHPVAFTFRSVPPPSAVQWE